MEGRLYIPVIGTKFDWEWLGYHLTLTCHFPLPGLSFPPSSWLFFCGLISFLSALCPPPPQLLAGAETRNSSSNLQPGGFSLPWSPGACSICSSVLPPSSSQKGIVGPAVKILKNYFFHVFTQDGKISEV